MLTCLREPACEKSPDASVSFEDPDGRFGYKGTDAPFCGYKVHQAPDPDSRLVVSGGSLARQRPRGRGRGTLLGGEVGGLLAGAAVIGDGLYGNTTAAGQVAAQHGVPVAV